MHVQAAYRPAHRAAPKRVAITRTVAPEPGLLEREKTLRMRVKITERTLERLLPSVEQTIQQRLANYRAAVPAERLAKLQMQISEQMMYSLQAELRPVLAERERARLLSGPVALPPAHVAPPHRPNRAQLLAMLSELSAMLSIDPGLDLHGYDLAYVDFHGAALAGANLLGCTLKGAAMTDVTMSHATLKGVDMQYTVLDRATLLFTDFAGCNLTHASLKGCSMMSASLVRATLARTDMSGSDLRHAKLDRAVLSYTNLSSCDLTGASWHGVSLAGVVGLTSCSLDNLRGVSFAGFDMSGLDLTGVDLAGASLGRCLHLPSARIDNLRGALLDRCSLAGVELGGVDLSGADLTGAGFREVRMSSPASAEGAKVDAYPFGEAVEGAVGAGTLVYYSGFLMLVTGEHPSNSSYAYYKEASSAWGKALGCGCFPKAQCRVLCAA